VPQPVVVVVPQPELFFPALGKDINKLLSAFHGRGLQVNVSASAGRELSGQEREMKTFATVRKKGNKVYAKTRCRVKNEKIPAVDMPVNLDLIVSTTNKCTAVLSTTDFGVKGTALRFSSTTDHSGETNLGGDLSFANECIATSLGAKLNYDKKSPGVYSWGCCI
jgi:hypothetical protein